MSYAKTIAAFITPIIVSILMPLGIDADTTVAQAIEIALVGIITAAAVYFTPNKPKA